jgi:arylsulfatase A-like enzyme
MSEGSGLRLRRLRAGASSLLGQSLWPSASLGALTLGCTIELVSAPRGVSATFIGYLFALGLLVGLLHGALWSLAFRALALLPRVLARGAWFIASAATMGWLAQELGAFTRLHSRYSRLAISVLIACAVGTLALGALLALLQPTAARPRGFLLEQGWKFRLLGALLLLMAAVGLRLADLRVYPNQYPLAHEAFRMFQLWALMFALALALPNLRGVSRSGWVLGLLGYGACLFLLDERRVVTLNTFQTHAWSAGVLALSRSLVDFDRDGQASFLGETDCAPWNPRVHPGAHEIPDNGIDENCVLGDATRRVTNVESVPLSAAGGKLDVVLITCDALNPLHLGVYNPYYGEQGRRTSPNLDRWAKNASVFEHGYTPGGWTSVAVPALLRGVYARKLQWRRYFETNRFAMVRARDSGRLRPGEQLLHMFPLAFDDPHPTLPEMLKRRGFVTRAVTDDGYSAMLERGTGIERGFDNYLEVDSLPEGRRNDAGTAQLALGLLASAPTNRRLFLWVHFFGTHWPTETHPGIRNYGTSPADTYDHEVAYLDTQLIRVLDAIAARKQPTAVFIAADHGEGLNNITRYHGDTLDEAVIRIPLLARVPGWPAGRYPQLASGLDLVPTILSLVGSPVPAYLDGIDLGTTLSEPRPRVLFSDTWRYDPGSQVVGDFAAAFDGSRRFILDRRTGNLYYASQTDLSALFGRLIGTTPSDALSAMLLGYIEESGEMRLRD